MTATIYKTEAGGELIRRKYEEWLAHWPVPAERRTVNTRHGDTFVMVSGTEHGPPVVLLHGSGGNTLMWMSLVGKLAGRFRLCAVDVIGEPGLSAPSRPPLRSTAHTEWLDDVLDGLGLTEVQMVGVSLGGLLAVDYATRRPERVTRLALLVPGGIGRQRYGRMAGFFLGQLLGKQPEPKSPQEKYIRMVFQHFRPRLFLPVFSDARLRRLTMPLLAIVAERDEVLNSRATQRRLMATVPQATVEMLPGVGHILPDQTERIGAFLHD